MLGTAISQIRLKVGILTAQWYVVVSQLKSLCNNIIAVGTDRMTLIAQYIKSQCVALKSSIKLCLVQLTNQALLIKVGLMNVLHSLGQVGRQLLITARQIPQRVLNLLKRGR